MSITLVDQALVDEVTSLLRGVLSNSYIIKQDILGQLPSKTVDSFIDTYGLEKGNHGVDIPLYFTFPQTPPKNAFLLAQFKGATEDTDNSVLGNLQGPLVDNDTGNLVHEKLVVQTKVVNGQKIAYLETKQPIKSIVSIPQTTTWDFGGNEIGLPYLGIYDKQKIIFDVFYNVKENQKGRSYPIGINTKEAVTIDFISSNTDTIRCLSGIFTYIEVYLRKTLEENANIYLPEIELNGMDMIEDVNSGDNSIGGQQLFYRRLQITYHVTQTIRQGAGEDIKKIILEEEDVDE